MQRKSPDTVKRLETKADNPDVIDAEIIEEVRQVAEANPDVKAAIDTTFQSLQAETYTFQNLTKLADKIGVVNLAPVQSQTNSITI